MALILECDGGCGARLDEKAATKLGRLDPVFYCHACAALWEAYEAAEEAKRIEMATAFEAWRTETLAAVKAGTFVVPDAKSKKKRALKTLPDEWALPTPATDAPAEDVDA